MAQRVALIGFGAIGLGLYRLLQERPAGEVEVVAVLVRDPARTAMQTPEAAPLVVDGLAALLARRPDLVVECAGHAAVDAHAAAVLQAGFDLLMVSSGSLADPERERTLRAIAQSAGRRLIVPAGAIGGIDWLGAARTTGLTRVLYRSRKPPAAWAGSPAEAMADLSALAGPLVFFRGTAREAALRFPRNANVAATVALAGLGFDATEVELVADPHADGNGHEIEASSSAGTMTLRIVGHADPRNPRTSVMTAHSVLRAVLHRGAGVLV